MKIVIANDHAAVDMKFEIIKYIESLGHEVINVGIDKVERCDYPDYAILASKKILNKEADLGILICGNGIGMSIAANKVKGIRAARAVTTDDAFKAKNHNGANVLALSSEVDIATTKEIIDTFLITKSATDERFKRRIDKISKYESSN